MVALFAALAVGFAQVVVDVGRVVAAPLGLLQQRDHLLAARHRDLGLEARQPQRGEGREVAVRRRVLRRRGVLRQAQIVVVAVLQRGMGGEEERLVVAARGDLVHHQLEQLGRFARVVARGDQPLVAQIVRFALELARVAEDRRDREHVRRQADQRRADHGQRGAERARALQVFARLVAVAVDEVGARVAQGRAASWLSLREARQDSLVQVDVAVGQRERVQALRLEDAHPYAAVELGKEPVRDALHVGRQRRVVEHPAALGEHGGELVRLQPQAVLVLVHGRGARAALQRGQRLRARRGRTARRRRARAPPRAVSLPGPGGGVAVEQALHQSVRLVRHAQVGRDARVVALPQQPAVRRSTRPGTTKARPAGSGPRTARRAPSPCARPRIRRRARSPAARCRSGSCRQDASPGPTV